MFRFHKSAATCGKSLAGRIAMEMLGATFEWWAAGSHPEIQRGFTLRSSRPITSMARGQFS
jgi:hypothetical protein